MVCSRPSNGVPFTIAVRADGPVRSVADLRGRRVIGKPDDAAMLLFPTLADACGIAPASVQVAVSHLPMGEQVRDGLMVTRRLLDQSPEAVRALVEGLNQGVYDTVADIDAGMAALARAAPGVNVAVQRRRLQGTLDIEMAHPEGARIGIGDVDDARLQRGIAHMARTLGWASAPSAAEVFRRDFLPPLEERVRSLVR